MNEHAGPFEGLDRFEARKAVVQRLDEEGFLVRGGGLPHTVPYSERGQGMPVEPLLSTQWFVKIRPPWPTKPWITWITAILPGSCPNGGQRFTATGLVNLRDWCISRQLWWGHQIRPGMPSAKPGGEITDETPFIVAAHH